MSNLKTCGLSKIFCILLVTTLIFSGLIFILIPGDEIEYSSTSTPNNTGIGHDARADLSNSQKFAAPEHQPITSRQATELELFNYNADDAARASHRTRSNDKFDYDLRIESINLSYPEFIIWWVNINNVYYPYYIAGEVGEPTNLSVTIKNIGNLNINSMDKAVIIINLTDLYCYSHWEQREYIGHLMPGSELKVNFTWIPTYSNSYNLTCNISFEKDQNATNNIIKANNLHVKKWNDNLEDGDISDWSGDISQAKWHLTTSVEADPSLDSHTNKFTFYHGLEQDGERDDYGERNDFDLITPEIDLRRFMKNKQLRLYFKYYGNTSETDELTIEGYKSSDQTWYPLDEIIFPDKTIDSSGNPAWHHWSQGFYLGIPIHTFAGELARFKIHWHSDQIPEDKIGFYLDDFFVYGFERPPPVYDVGIEAIEINPNDKPIMVGQEFQIKANITNYGTEPISDLVVETKVQDLTGRRESVKPMSVDTITGLAPGESKWLSWKVIPSVAGIYYVNISADLALDEVLQNNFITSETVEVYLYYNSFEGVDETWVGFDGWYRLNVTNDPEPTQHSWSNAWYVGNISSKYLDLNMTSILYSPIIDLDGAQGNDEYKADQIRIDFKWYGKASGSDRLYFEYAKDLSNNWALFNTPTKKNSTISGDYSGSWHSWGALGTEELFGHHLQFRWRFESDSTSDFEEIGYYIDDFSIWVVQEQAGRPKILGCDIKPRAIINDSHDEASITCEVAKGSSDLEEVYVNLEPIGGPTKQVLFDDGTNGDMVGNDNIYTVKVTVPPTVEKGERILKISALDINKNFDNDYLKIIIKENLPPMIESTFPSNSTVILYENEGLEFSVHALDPEGGVIQYNWYFNSVLDTYWTDNYFQFNSSFHGEISAGNYTVGVQVMDDGLPGKTDYFEWFIEVVDVLPDFQILEDDVILDNYNVTAGELVEVQVQVYNLQPPPEYNVTVWFIQQSANASIPDSVFSSYNISLFKGRASTFIIASWNANISYNYIKIWVDPENKIIELNEDNNIVIIPINVSQEPEPIQPPQSTPNRESSDVPSYLYILTAGVIATLISLAFAIGTEFGRYKIFQVFIPLYYRVTGDKVLEHELRSKIYMHIRAHPGDHYRSIMAALNIKNGTLVHHLSRLEQEDLIKSERDGYFKRFYPVGMKIPKSEVGMYYPEAIPTYNIGEHQVSEIQLRIIKTIRNHPGLTQKAIAQRINESRRVVNYHIKLLLQHDLIKVIKLGRKTQCYVPEQVVSS
ncbi:CARDB domain-containing protein [[Eubacterium] cellulosolvens]